MSYKTPCPYLANLLGELLNEEQSSSRWDPFPRVYPRVNKDHGKIWVVSIDLNNLYITTFTSLADGLHPHDVILTLQLRKEVVHQVGPEVRIMSESIWTLLRFFLLFNFHSSDSVWSFHSNIVFSPINCLCFFINLSSKMFRNKMCLNSFFSCVIFQLPGLEIVSFLSLWKCPTSVTVSLSPGWDNIDCSVTCDLFPVTEEVYRLPHPQPVVKTLTVGTLHPL